MFEERPYILLVGFLRALKRISTLQVVAVVTVEVRKRMLPCKATLVHAVVNLVVSPLVRRLDLVLQILGKEIDFPIFLGDDIVEFGIEHADDLARFVVDDRLLLHVVQHRHSKPSFVLRVDLEVNIP